MNKGDTVVSKETVVLHRWGSCTQKFGFINGIDHHTVILKADVSGISPFVRANRGIMGCV